MSSLPKSSNTNNLPRSSNTNNLPRSNINNANPVSDSCSNSNCSGGTITIDSGYGRKIRIPCPDCR